MLHIRDFVGRIKTYTEAGREAFAGYEMIQDAVVRHLALIGEGLKNIYL